MHKTKLIGEGLTVRAVLDLDLSDEAEVPLARLKRVYDHLQEIARASRPGKLWADRERYSRRLLRDAGFPTRAGFYRHRHGRWDRWAFSDPVMLQFMKASSDPAAHLGGIL